MQGGIPPRRDRPEEGWLNKTGESYRALVLNAELAEALRQCGSGLIVPDPDPPKIGRPYTRERWFKHIPQRWLKPFVGDVRKPLHRLRGLYADQRSAFAEDAMLAKLAGERAAADALGHTTTKTTRDHYLSDQK